MPAFGRRPRHPAPCAVRSVVCSCPVSLRSLRSLALHFEHPVEREAGQALRRLGDDDLVVDLPSTSPSSIHSRWFGDTRNIVEHRQPNGSSVTTVLSGATSCVRRLTRWISVATAQTVPAGLFLTVLMMCSVEPLTSAAWTTSNVHSGCAMTLPSGYFFRNASICCTVKRVWTEQCPFHRISLACLTCSGVEAAPDLVRIPDDHLVERHAHLVGGVAARDAGPAASAASRRAPTPTCMTAAALVDVQTMPPCVADERFDRGRRVDVGDRDHAGAFRRRAQSVSTPISLSSRQHISS